MRLHFIVNRCSCGNFDDFSCTGFRFNVLLGLSSLRSLRRKGLSSFYDTLERSRVGLKTSHRTFGFKERVLSRPPYFIVLYIDLRLNTLFAPNLDTFGGRTSCEFV